MSVKSTPQQIGGQPVPQQTAPQQQAQSSTTPQQAGSNTPAPKPQIRDWASI